MDYISRLVYRMSYRPGRVAPLSLPTIQVGPEKLQLSDSCRGYVGLAADRRELVHMERQQAQHKLQQVKNNECVRYRWCCRVSCSSPRLIAQPAAEQTCTASAYDVVEAPVSPKEKKVRGTIEGTHRWTVRLQTTRRAHPPHGGTPLKQ